MMNFVLGCLSFALIVWFVQKMGSRSESPALYCWFATLILAEVCMFIFLWRFSIAIALTMLLVTLFGHWEALAEEEV